MEQDESWFSRFAQPQAHGWAEAGQELRLVQREPKRAESDKAVACFGAGRHDTDEVLLYFSTGQPNSLQMWLCLLTHLLTVKSPWLNPIEPRWVHAKRGVCEPDGELTPTILQRRLCAHFQTQPLLNSFNF